MEQAGDVSALLAPFVALERSALGLAIRDAHVLYPLANIAHVLCVIVFFALVAAMDMAVIRNPRPLAEATIARARPWAILAFLGVIASGAIMFTAEAGALVKNPAFLAKMAAVVAGGINLALFSRWARNVNPGPQRASAAFSMFLWLFAAAAGRGIAYL